MAPSQRTAQAHHNASNVGFVFIQTSFNGSVKDRRTQRTIKKHVMRDIGKARRIYDVSDDDNEEDNLSLKDGAKQRRKSIVSYRPSSDRVQTQSAEQPQAYSSSSATAQTIPESHKVAREHTTSEPRAPFSILTKQDRTSLHDEISKDFCSFAASPASLLDTFHGDPFAKYPLQLSLPMKRLISLIFDTTLPPNLTQYRETWYWIALENAASFYQVLANFALHILSITTAVSNRTAAKRNHFVSDEESLGYHLMAVKHVNSRLSSLKQSDWIDDGIIGAVAGFVCYAHLTQDWTAWKSHMDGLKVLVKRRGGIWTIEKNVPLASMLIFVEVVSSSTIKSTTDILPPDFHAPPPSCLLSSLRTNACQNQTSFYLLCAWRHRFPNHALSLPFPPNTNPDFLTNTLTRTLPPTVHLNMLTTNACAIVDPPRLPKKPTPPPAGLHTLFTDAIGTLTHLMRESARTDGATWRHEPTISRLLNPLMVEFCSVLRHPLAYVARQQLHSIPGAPFARPSLSSSRVELVPSVTARNMEIELAFIKLVASAALLVLWRVKRGVEGRVGELLPGDDQEKGARKTMSLLTRAIKDSLETLSESQSRGDWTWGSLGALKIWALVVGLLEVGSEFEKELEGDHERRVWFRREVRQVLTEKGGSAELKSVYEGVLWVKEVQGERLEEVFEKIREEDGHFDGL